MAVTEHLISAEELSRMPNPGMCELVRGEIMMMSPAGSLHGKISARLGALLYRFVEEKKLGTVFGAETGFHITRNPDSVRAPDVAFIRADRLPENLPEGFFDGPPDLAVEVLSPNDRASEVQSKIRDWLAAGCLAVWVVDPGTKSMTVYKNDGDITALDIDDVLTDAQLLPGFHAAIKDIFE
jgi:Uma2 family endonuclease